MITLAGSKCRNCGEVTFPALLDCPLCVQPDVMDAYRLVGHGSLRDYVIAERGPQGFDVPYVQAWIQLDDGPVVYSTVATGAPREFAAERGARMTMVLAPFGSGATAFTGWKFVCDEAGHG